MAGPKRTLEALKRGGSNIAFRDFQRLMEKLGFRLNRISGRHHIYIQPSAPIERYNRRVRIEARRVTVNRYAIIVFWSEDDRAWVADVPDLKSCTAFGSTPEEALAEVRIAMG